MAFESLVVLGLATAFLAGIAWYADSHRENEKESNDDSHPPKA